MRRKFLRQIAVAIAITNGFNLCVWRSQATDYTWNGGSGDWSVAANWTPNGVPAAGDSVTVAGGTVTVNTDTRVSNVNFSGGVISGSGTLSMVSNLVWTGGQMSG